MEFLALVCGDPDSWDAMSESDRATAYEGYMAVARDAEAAPATRLNHSAAVALAGGVEDGLELIAAIPGLGGDRHFYSARADLLRRLGREDEARAAYSRALALAEKGPNRGFWSDALPAERSCRPDRRGIATMAA